MDNFLGEIRLFAFSKIPDGWLACNGQALPINQYQALYALLGMRYGGNGTTTFNLPDMRGRVPVHVSPMPNQGLTGGSETVTLTNSQVPAHTHTVSAYTSAANTGVPLNNFPAQVVKPSGTTVPDPPATYGSAAGLTAVSPQSVTDNMGNASTAAIQAHENRQPTMALSYCIATTGIFPSRAD